MLAYYVEWHMRELLAPILFDDEDKDLAGSLRQSVVAPAKRSPTAKLKEETRRTKEGLPVHSFQTLLTDLATIIRDVCRLKVSNAPLFTKVTLKSPIQKKAFQLLKLKM